MRDGLPGFKPMPESMRRALEALEEQRRQEAMQVDEQDDGQEQGAGAGAGPGPHASERRRQAGAAGTGAGPAGVGVGAAPRRAQEALVAA